VRLDYASLPGKLADCQEKRPWQVRTVHRRGRPSAGGSAKMGRNREFQAVLPLRGKILNVERPRASTRCWAPSRSAPLITALGTGIGRDDFRPVRKLRLSTRSS